MKIKKQIMAALVLLGAGVLTGCVKKDVDYSIDSVNEGINTKADSGKSSMTQLADESGWEDSWETNDGRSVKIKADIIVPETEQVAVVEVEAPECNAEFKEQIAKSLFDNEIVYYHDFDHLTKKDLQKQYDQYKESYDVIHTDNPTMLSLDEEKMEEIEAAMENAVNDYTPADEYEGDEYIGEYGGTEYVLSVGGAPYGINSDNNYGIEMTIYANDISSFSPQEYEEYTYCMEYPDTDMIENECRISEEEAEKRAVEFMEKLGLEYPVLSDIKPLIWGDVSMFVSDNYQDCPANGYVFRFDYGLDGVSFPGFGCDEEYWSSNSNVNGLPESDGKQYYTGAKLKIYVTEQGIVRMTAANPVKTAGITESVGILPLNEIKDIMKNQITENYADFRFDNPTGGKALEFTHMELIYFRVTDNDNTGNYSYIPAWRLSKQTEDEYGRYINNPVVINAIDGSVIKLQEK